jgi:hypothetical protein
MEPSGKGSGNGGASRLGDLRRPGHQPEAEDRGGEQHPFQYVADVSSNSCAATGAVQFIRMFARTKCRLHARAV